MALGAKPDDRIGGQYRLIRVLGRGGMGDVWLAHNETLDIDVAIKLVHSASERRDAAESLLSEARAAARLGHPAIVRIFDFGKTDAGAPYIVMERLEGEDLATAFGRLGRLSPVKAVRTLLPIAHALAAAHAKGIVHRDLKPENVFLAKMEGDLLQPKVVDFGIAQVDRAEAMRRSGARGVVGSPAYMSPEQARGEKVDPRADVWSFSVVLYEAISGQKPFSGPTADQTIQAIVSAPPAPLPKLPGLDAALEKLIARGLEKLPEARFATMRELGEALAEWLLARDVSDDITGASVETSWGERKSGDAADPLGAARVAPAELPRAAAVATVINAPPPGPAPPEAPSPSSQRLVVAVAAVAVIAGIGLGVALTLRGKKASHGDVRLSAQTPSPAMASSAPKAPIPVAPLEAIPVDPGASTENGKTPKSAGAGAGAGATSKPLRKPRRSLKDPFQ